MVEIGEVVTQFGKDLSSLVLKVTYPVVGNLSPFIKEGLQKKVGDAFNAEHATITSYITNWPLYSYAIFLLYKNCLELPPGYTEREIASAVAAGALLCIVEDLFRYFADRVVYSDGTHKEYKAPSLIGAILSLSGAYIQNLIERTKKSEKI